MYRPAGLAAEGAIVQLIGKIKPQLNTRTPRGCILLGKSERQKVYLSPEIKRRTAKYAVLELVQNFLPEFLIKFNEITHRNQCIFH